MCCGCYEKAGSPLVMTGRVFALVELRALVYEFSTGGGRLHIVLDDFNIEDHSVAFCAKEIADHEPEDDCDRMQLAIEVAACRVLAAMSIPERATAIGWECIAIGQRQRPDPGSPLARAIHEAASAIAWWDTMNACDEMTRKQIGEPVTDAYDRAAAALDALVALVPA